MKFNRFAEKIVAAQINAKLDDHRKKLEDLHNNLKSTLLLEITNSRAQTADSVMKLVEDSHERSECKLAIPDDLMSDDYVRRKPRTSFERAGPSGTASSWKSMSGKDTCGDLSRR